jgi:hypothetical protein
MATEPVVEAVELDAAHDSEGLVILTFRYEGGGRSRLQLPGEGLGRLLRSLGLARADDLVGRRFSELAPGLPANAGDERPQ